MLLVARGERTVSLQLLLHALPAFARNNLQFFIQGERYPFRFGALPNAAFLASSIDALGGGVLWLTTLKLVVVPDACIHFILQYPEDTRLCPLPRTLLWGNRNLVEA